MIRIHSHSTNNGYRALSPFFPACARYLSSIRVAFLSLSFLPELFNTKNNEKLEREINNNTTRIIRTPNSPIQKTPQQPPDRAHNDNS